MPKHDEPNEKALAAIVARKAEIDKLLALLKERSDERLGLASEETHWGHVGELDDWPVCLKRIAKLSGLPPLDG